MKPSVNLNSTHVWKSSRIGKTENREGVIYYLRDGRIRGVPLWNTWGQVDAARELIAGNRTFKPAELRKVCCQSRVEGSPVRKHFEGTAG